MPRKQLLALVLLCGVLGFVLYRQLTPDTTGGASAPSNVAGQNTASSGGGGTDVADVRLELLQAQGEPYTAPKRDPFRFRQQAAPAVTQTLKPAVDLTPKPFVPPPPPPPPPIGSKLRVLGILVGQSGLRVASLSDGTAAPPILAVQGDVVLGLYRVLRVDVDAVEMAYADGTGARARIPLPDATR